MNVKFSVIVTVYTIIDPAAAFQKPMRELRCELESVDSDCPNQHYTKYGAYHYAA